MKSGKSLRRCRKLGQTQCNCLKYEAEIGFIFFVFSNTSWMALNFWNLDNISHSLFCLWNQKESIALRFCPDSLTKVLRLLMNQDKIAAQTYFFSLLYFCFNFCFTLEQNRVHCKDSIESDYLLLILSVQEPLKQPCNWPCTESALGRAGGRASAREPETWNWTLHWIQTQKSSPSPFC
jgi:hypothetical protein